MAADLVGCRLIADPGTPHVVVARLVEVEAYLGTRDPASHAFRGPTPRAAIMFGPPGHLYVYLSYGVHHCANLVCEPPGAAGAVLLRAAAVEVGEEVVRRRRTLPGSAELRSTELLSGPGNLCRGLAIELRHNGLDVCAPLGRLSLEAIGDRVPVVVSPRVGISRATDLPLRFSWAGHPAVSRPRPWAHRPRPADVKRAGTKAGPTDAERIVGARPRSPG